MATHDAGSGAELVVGGTFDFAGGTSASNLARWNGSRWRAFGTGTNGSVRALTVHDGMLHVGGSFSRVDGTNTGRIARWDGTRWSALGAGIPSGTVQALVEFDDGSGPALYVGGNFTSAGGLSANRVARWDGTSWSVLGSGTNSEVTALAVYDDGSGPALYAGGTFTSAGGLSASRIARWNGSTWSALDSGVSAPVRALLVHDDGHGPSLWVAGEFTTAGAIGLVNHVARWDAAGWHASTVSATNGPVYALATYDDGGGPALYAGGDFTTPGNRVARWNGTTWLTSSNIPGLDPSTMPSLPSVSAMHVFDEGTGPELMVGGNFEDTVTVTAIRIAAWDGNAWSALGDGLSRPVGALLEFDDGSGNALFANEAEGKVPARWDGNTWSAVGTGLVGSVSDLAVYDDGGGPRLYVSGRMVVAPGQPFGRVARLDGTSWTFLEQEPPMSLELGIEALAVHDDGSGPMLYAGGLFEFADGVPVHNVARWNGGSWSAVGDGLDGQVTCLAVHDDGGGPKLYAGGSFHASGAVAASRVAVWDGSSWSPLGSGVDGPVEALGVLDDGSGPALFVGGFFASAGGQPASHLARWDGATWSALGQGVNARVHALRAFDDGAGSALYVTGSFTAAGGAPASHIARWDGTAWTTLGEGLSNDGNALALFDDGSGPALHVGGRFFSAFQSQDSYLARRACDATPPEIEVPAPILVFDHLGSPPGEPVVFDVSATDNGDLAPLVVCTPPSGSVFPLGTTTVTCTAIDTAGNQTSRDFTVTVLRKARRWRL